jgi:hypothetical protein
MVLVRRELALVVWLLGDAEDLVGAVLEEVV